jgi:hypothetical protein
MYENSPLTTSPEPERFFREEKEVLYPFPHPQQLAEGLPDSQVRGGLMDWYRTWIASGTVPVSGVRKNGGYNHIDWSIQLRYTTPEMH